MVGAPPRQPYTLYQRRPRESTRAHTRKKWASCAKAIKNGSTFGCFIGWILDILSFPNLFWVFLAIGL